MKRRYIIIIALVLLGAGFYIANSFLDSQHSPNRASPQQEEADRVRSLLR